MPRVYLFIEYAAKFSKQIKRSPKEVQHAAIDRIEIFTTNPNHSLLRNHKLQGYYEGCRSINITGDWRAVYREEKDGEAAYFLALGTHNQLYR